MLLVLRLDLASGKDVQDPGSGNWCVFYLHCFQTESGSSGIAGPVKSASLSFSSASLVAPLIQKLRCGEATASCFCLCPRASPPGFSPHPTHFSVSYLPKRVSSVGCEELHSAFCLDCDCHTYILWSELSLPRSFIDCIMTIYVNCLHL